MRDEDKRELKSDLSSRFSEDELAHLIIWALEGIEEAMGPVKFEDFLRRFRLYVGNHV